MIETLKWYLLRPVLFVLGQVALRQAHRWQRAFFNDIKDPKRVQDQLLERILAQQADTDFGRQHHFRSIRNLADFRKNLPIHRYEDLDPYIAQVRKGHFNALVNARHIHMFAMTSGTTAQRKYIPVTDQYLYDYRRGMTIWGVGFFDKYKKMLLRPILQLTSDWDEFRSEANIPCGSVSGLSTMMQRRIVRRFYCLPPLSCKIKEHSTKTYLALRSALPRKKLTLVVSANPSTLIKLAQFGDEHKEDLIRDLFDGTLSQRFEWDPALRSQLEPLFRKKMPDRARELEDIVHRTGHLYPKDCFPELQGLGHWTGGSVGLYVRHLPRYYGDAPAIRDLGLLASEGRFSIPLEDRTASGVLDVTSHFYEFIPEGEIDSPQPTVLTAMEVEEGKNYYILPTTAYGLYRYNIFDVVRVTGFHERTPMIEFLNKGSLFSNLTGEKLSEFQVNSAVKQAALDLNLLLHAFVLAPCFNETRPFYGLFVERRDFGDLGSLSLAQRFTQSVDRYLRACNLEYDAKRASDRLGDIQPIFVANGAWAQWDRERLQRTGGTAEQYKRPSLIADPHFRDQMPIEMNTQPVEQPQ